MFRAMAVAALALCWMSGAKPGLADEVELTGLVAEVYLHIRSICRAPDKPEVVQFELGHGKLAWIVYSPCDTACGSGGCPSEIVVEHRVYRIFGSKPIFLQGGNISAIG